MVAQAVQDLQAVSREHPLLAQAAAVEAHREQAAQPQTVAAQVEAVAVMELQVPPILAAAAAEPPAVAQRQVAADSLS